MRSTTTAPAFRVLLGLLAAIVALPLHALETLIGVHFPEARGYDLVLRAVLPLLPYELLPGISRRLMPAAYADVQWRFDTEVDSRAVALTVDDWPGDDLARGLALLAVLKQHSVRATFFVTSSACGCATGRKLMAAACAAGHQLCNHLPEDRLVRPRRPSLCVPPAHATPPQYACDADADVRAALLETKAVIDGFVDAAPQIEAAAAEAPRRLFYRPPSGACSAALARQARALGMTAVLGDVYSADPAIGAAVVRRSTVDWHVRFLARRARPGSVVILHTPMAGCRQQTGDICERLLPLLQAKGMEFRTLGEMAGGGG